MMVLYVIGWLFSIFAALVLVVWITVKNDNSFDLSQESEDLKNNNKNK